MQDPIKIIAQTAKNEKRWVEVMVTKPFTLHEFTHSLKTKFAIRGAAELSVWREKAQVFVVLKTVDDIQDECKIRIAELGGSLWIHPLDQPWKPAGPIEEILVWQSSVQNQVLWERFRDLMGKMMPSEKDPTKGLLKVIAVKNENLRTGFESIRLSLLEKHTSDPARFKKNHWKKVGPMDQERTSSSENDRNRRLRFSDYLQDYIGQFEENEDTTIGVVPMLHCTHEESVSNILKGGFGTVAKVDDGYYGQGMYFTRDMGYAGHYGDHKTFVIAAVIVGNAFPVTEHPQDKNSLLGKPTITGYQSHYTVGTLKAPPFPSIAKPPSDLLLFFPCSPQGGHKQGLSTSGKPAGGPARARRRAGDL